ncbi:hypothetical protein HMPREF0083_02448 [Aneurinibacillus aneurinilyticus ATCC 12856]|uniref:Uncharacterized protein n=2 Tax=Aneurinibacillus aneurinilyticus TaxID=1391 RepID=U1WLK8_ANEAE|nr:hypothetical protein HMPREF0083_02448 [Aneurinibacillus aneurinilyticus ATCC 12856]
MFCGPAWLRQKADLYASVWETNRRLFGTRCGGCESKKLISPLCL